MCVLLRFDVLPCPQANRAFISCFIGTSQLSGMVYPQLLSTVVIINVPTGLKASATNALPCPDLPLPLSRAACMRPEAHPHTYACAQALYSLLTGVLPKHVKEKIKVCPGHTHREAASRCPFVRWVLCGGRWPLVPAATTCACLGTGDRHPSS